MSIVFDFESIAANLSAKEPKKHTTFITVGNRHSVSDTIRGCLMSALGSSSQEAVGAFNASLGEVDRLACRGDYEFMCAVMKRARAKL